MKPSYNFYVLTEPSSQETTQNSINLANYTIEVFRPSLFQLKRHNASSLFIYLFWFIVTRGSYQIVYLIHQKKIIHYSHLLPKFFKFPFMQKSDLEIGPSWTDESYRGKGIFPSIICYISINFQKPHRNFHIIVRQNNRSSIKAIEKSGARLIGDGIRTPLLGIYTLLHDEKSTS